MYSVQHDPPWAHKPHRGSTAPSASVYSDDDEYDVGRSRLIHPDMPVIAPLRYPQKPSHLPSYHAHPNQHIKDMGPQARQSKLPLFKQVRGLLHRPPPLQTGAQDVKYDVFSGDFSAAGKAPEVRPSAYRNPYEGTFEARRTSRPLRRQSSKPQRGRNASPVSVLNDREIEDIMYSPDLGWDGEVSPVDEADEDAYRTLGQSELSHAARPVTPETPPNQAIKAIQRKPAPSRHSRSPDNVAPDSDPHSWEASYDGILDFAHPFQTSHFSWTTSAPSVAPHVAILDADIPPSRRSNQQPSDAFPSSRFSWSTTNTHMTQHAHPNSPQPSLPPPVPTKYKTPPVQSILSRQRPIQRLEKEEWTPPIRKTSLPDPEPYTPHSARSALPIHSRPASGHSTGKKLPLPPELLTPISPMSHLETLLAEEQDKVRQRRNIEHAIVDLTKVKKASPMEVSYAQVKDADRKLAELRTTLAEVQLEEREIGIAISRARRKEGEDGALWVRRVTG